MNLRVRHLNINYSIQIKVIAEWNSSAFLFSDNEMVFRYFLLLFKKNNKMQFVVGKFTFVNVKCTNYFVLIYNKTSIAFSKVRLIMSKHNPFESNGYILLDILIIKWTNIVPQLFSILTSFGMKLTKWTFSINVSLILLHKMFNRIKCIN